MKIALRIRSYRFMFPNTPWFSAHKPKAARFSFTALIAALLVVQSVACGGEPSPTATRPPDTPVPTASQQPSTPTPTATKLPATSTAVPTPPPSTPTATPEPPPIATPQPGGALVSLPEDEAPHDTPVEWWYFNGFLRDESGNEYSYHFVTFQSPTLPVGTPHLLHASLSNHRRGIHHTGERGTLAAVPHDAQGVDIYANGWAMSGGDGGSYELQFDLGGTALQLNATSGREPVLHDSTGLVHLGNAGSTYYYSRTRMNLDGWVEDAAGRRPVTGTGWMDHQWGAISRVDVGWDWVNLQLHDGSDLMVAVVWQPGEKERMAAYATFVAPDGVTTHVPGEGVELEAKGAWVSPETGIEYPMGWRLAIGPLDLELDLAAVLEHAEFQGGQILPVAYWEGAVTASGQRSGASIEGRGFVELVGYDPQQIIADIPTP